MSKKNELFNTPSVKVSWANIADPDEYRGTVKHQIQVIVDDECMAALNTAAKGSNINGLREDKEGNLILKAKSTVYTKEGETRFGRVFDSAGKETEVNPYRGDTVRLRLSPFKLQDESVSFFLNAVQIVEKVEYTAAGGGSGFDSVDGGFTAEAPVVAEDSDDVPF